MLLLDSCALLWWTLDCERLSATAREACQTIGQTGGYVSSISLWELGLKVKKGKLDLGLPFSSFFDHVRHTAGLEILSVDETIWLENLNLDWEHPDPVDRTIVATAKLRHLPIVTADGIIRRFYPQTIW